ncbi:phosphatase inhibitor [Podospora aff. communis PSN243]|uniref:Type 1 phosphatases regulator n=1 Tax=Podospora aff. communis PSN243 TaxID=3040156 RepID=A0AAV9H7H4_9PEZI|nr:phosphatase inhibitor [Podospora aff. communis PSN243]
MASTASQQRQAQSQQITGGQTQISTQPATQQTETRSQAVLILRGASTSNGRSVQWREDVVDNEGLGRKSSKVCCIYHRPRAVGESSDESSSDSSSSSSDSDSDSGREGARPSKKMGEDKGKKPSHDHDHDCGSHSHGHRRSRRDGNGKRRRPSPNAYEKMPKNKPRDQGPSNDKNTAPAK